MTTTLPRRLLERNDCPSEHEEVVVRDHLSELTTKSMLIDAEITQLLQHLQSLQQTRTALQEDIALHQPVMSIARRIPFEILEQILYHCLPETRNPAMSVMDAPLKFARVCSSWRSVVYQAPRLWTRLHLAVPSSLLQPINHGGLPSPPIMVGEAVRKRETDIARRRMKTAVEWLERGLDHPVSISFACGPNDYALSEVLNIMWDAILGFSERWADVDIELPLSPYMPFNRLQTLSPERTPRLRSIRLRCLIAGGPAPIVQPTWFRTRLLLAPLLEAIHLIGFAGAYSLDMAWSQITELTLEDCDLPGEEAHRVLSETTNIRRCRLHISRSSFPVVGFPAAADAIITLAHLESFTLIERGSFTAKIRAPNLKQFTYQAYRSDWEHFDMFELTKDHNGRATGHDALESVTFDPTTILPHTISAFLALTPNVKDLSLEIPNTHIRGAEWKWTSNAEFDDYFLSALMPGSDMWDVPHYDIGGMFYTFPKVNPGSVVCPKLRRFKCTSRAGFTDAYLLKFIRRRVGPSSQDGTGTMASGALGRRDTQISMLQQVVVKFDRAVEVDIGSALRDGSKDALGAIPESFDLKLIYKETVKPLANPGHLSPWKGIRSREAVPECITWVVPDESL